MWGVRKSSLHFLIITLDSIIVAMHFYLIYYTFILTFTLKGAISFINAVAFRGFLAFFIHKLYKVRIKGKWTNPRKGAAPSLSPQFSCYSKESLRVSLGCDRPAYYIYIYIYILIKLKTIVEYDPKAPFSIATTLRCRGGRFSFSWIAPLYPWAIPYICPEIFTV